MIRVSENCEQDNPCSGNKCPKHSECVPSWHNYTCKCHTGSYCLDSYHYKILVMCFLKYCNKC